MDPWRGVSPRSLEAELRPLVQDVRLIAELDLSLAGEVYRKARSASGRLISRGSVGSLHVVCPSATVIFLVAEGMHRYEGGKFWPNVSVSGIDVSNQSDIGLEFLGSLERLDLETFEDVVHREGAWRYVTPILLHGGIPAYCASDLWRCLLEEMRWGEEDAGRLLARWRSRQYLLQGVDKPAQRFVFHGGDFAVDLVQRMIELAGDVAELGKAKAVERGAAELAAHAVVPRYLVEKLLEGPKQPQRRGPRVPKPRVFLDPYSGEGPHLLFPSSPGLGGEWRVLGKGKRQSYKASYDPREVPLVPAPRWEVTFVSHLSERSTSFAPMDEVPVYIFEDSGELARNQTSMRGDSVLVLASRQVSFYKDHDQTEKVPEEVELPSAVGVWSAWQPRRLDLSGLTKVVICGVGPSGGPFSRTVAVTESTHRPRLVGDHLPGVVGANGQFVFGHPPRVRVDLGTTSRGAWRVRFRTSYDSTLKYLSDLDSDGSDENVFDLSPLFPAGGVVSGVIEVVGPLGSDLRTPVIIVPGMDLTMPGRVVAPDEPVVVRLSADVAIGDSSAGRVDLDFSAGEYTRPVSAGPGHGDLLVSVPRLVWALRYRDGRSSFFAGRPESIGLDEFENGDIEGVLVRVGRPSPVRLELHAKECIQASEEVTTTGTEGRWRFPVGEFQTSAAHADAARLELRLVCGEVVATVAVIEATHEVSDVEMESLVDVEDGFTYCEVRWCENRAFKDREIRLWSNQRPWEPPINEPVPDTNQGHCGFVIEDNLPPGPYLLEVGIGDPWSLPVRPSTRATNATEVTLGTDGDLQRHLAALDEGDSLAALELESAGRGPVRSLDEGLVGDILEELRSALVFRHRYTGPDCVSDRVYGRLSELALLRPDHLAEIISEIGHTVSEQDLVRVLISLVQGILDCAPSGIDEPVLDQLWTMSPVVGAAFDTYRRGDRRSAGRWRSFTGWDPSMPYDEKDDYEEADQLPSRGGPIQPPLDTCSPDQLRALASVLEPSDVQVLRWSGYFDAAIDFLTHTYGNRAAVEQWRSTYETITTSTDWLDPVHHSYLGKLETSDGVPGWCSFPRDLLACVFHLVAFGGEYRLAARALWSSVEFAPELTNRSLVLAIVLHRL